MANMLKIIPKHHHVSIVIACYHADVSIQLHRAASVAVIYQEEMFFLKWEEFLLFSVLYHRSFFSQQTFSLVIVGKAQVILITLTMALLYSSVPPCNPQQCASMHNTRTPTPKWLKGIQPLLISVFTSVLFLL